MWCAALDHGSFTYRAILSRMRGDCITVTGSRELETYTLSVHYKELDSWGIGGPARTLDERFVSAETSVPSKD